MTINGEIFDIPYDYSILVNTADWLIRKGKLKDSDIPLKITRGRRYLINRKPEHSDGTGFFSYKTLSNGFYIMTNNSSFQHENYARRLLEKFGERADALKIEGLRQG